MAYSTSVYQSSRDTTPHGNIAEKELELETINLFHQTHHFGKSVIKVCKGMLFNLIRADCSSGIRFEVSNNSRYKKLLS